MSRFKRKPCYKASQQALPVARPLKQKLKDRILSTEIATFRHICKVLDTETARLALSYVDEGDWLSYLKMERSDLNSVSFPEDYLITSLMSKNPRLPLSLDRRGASVHKFYSSEDSCRQTNELIQSVCEGRANFLVRPDRLSGIRKFISDVLGPLSHDKLEYIHRCMRFGPGATFHCSSKGLTPSKKIESFIGFTPRLAPYIHSMVEPLWLSSSMGLAPCKGNKAAFVPKTSLVDRFIAIEPTLNLRGQLGIGALLRKQLRYRGLNLDYQADVNRSRVRQAQKDGLATIDLASASDTIAYRLVMELLPPDWFALLDLFRSPKTYLDDQWIEIEKFSSMGNGYTFELESLIFWAIARQYDVDACVFGDDIITSQEAASSVIKCLNSLGFKTNEQKTFMAGVFFESCGVDYWNGQNVRPFYFRSEYYDYPSSIIRMANAIRRYATRRYGCFDHNNKLYPVWHRLIARCSIARRTYIPEGYGDDGLVRAFDESLPQRLPDGHQGYRARVWHHTAKQCDVTTRGSALVAYLFGYGDPERRLLKPYRFDSKHTRTFQSVRGESERGHLRDMPVFDWHEPSLLDN